jgi:hypothetical protein
MRRGGRGWAERVRRDGAREKGGDTQYTMQHANMLGAEDAGKWRRAADHTGRVHFFPIILHLNSLAETDSV